MLGEGAVCSPALPVKSAVSTEGTYRPVTPRLTHGTAPHSLGHVGCGASLEDLQIHHPQSPTLSRTYTHLHGTVGLNHCFFFLRASSLVYIT